MQVINTLTGFKYIGDQINAFESHGKNEFLIGYEESYGYLVGTHARDKDAVVTAMILSEMAARYKKQDKTLINVLDDLYNEYGYYLDYLELFTFTGAHGAEKIQKMMEKLRQADVGLLPDIVAVQDFALGIDGLPRENVLKFILMDGSWFAIRPSGTEPKIKIYYSIKGLNRELAGIKLESIQKQIKESMQL